MFVSHPGNGGQYCLSFRVLSFDDRRLKLKRMTDLLDDLRMNTENILSSLLKLYSLIQRRDLVHIPYVLGETTMTRRVQKSNKDDDAQAGAGADGTSFGSCLICWCCIGT